MRKLKRELWPYLITIVDPAKAEEVEIWTGLNMGPFKQRWNVVYHYEKYDFYFKDGKDATMFALRWS